MKYNPSRFFAYLRNKKKSNKTISCLRKANGQPATCPKETAEQIYLWSLLLPGVYQRESSINENCGLENVPEQINEFTVNKEEVVRQQLKSLNTHKAARPNGLHPLIIRTLAENNCFVNTVIDLFQTVATKCRPNSWTKRAICTALHNYRPISLTFILCKVFEKLLFRHLYTHVCDQTASARTNKALSKARPACLIFQKQCMRSTQF